MRRLLVVPILAVLLAAPVVFEARAGEHPFSRAAAILEAAVPAVEKACGATFTKPPVVRIVSLSEAERLAAEDLRPELERKYPGVTEGQMRFVSRMASSTSVRSAIARYSVAAKAILLVRQGFEAQCKQMGIEPVHAGPVLAAAIAHEAVHALDDQRFDIGKLYRGAKDTEALKAGAMVVEGRAVHFGRIAAAEIGVPREFRNRLPGGDEPKDLRATILHETYRYGARFTAALIARGGMALADRAMREPPTTTHHVCQPDRWPDGKVSALPAKILRDAGILTGAHALSELELRCRYRWLDGEKSTETLFAAYRGGMQAIVKDVNVNVAVLAFADAASAKRYADRSLKDASVVYAGGVAVLRVSSASKSARESFAARVRELVEAGLR